MRKKRRNILTLLLAFILMLSMTACAASGKTEAPAEPAETEAEPGTEETGASAMRAFPGSGILWRQRAVRPSW